MKIRSGFVSNSSSSSFILSTPLSKKQIKSGKLTFTFEAKIDSVIDHIITDLKELDEFCKEEYDRSLDIIVADMENPDNDRMYMTNYINWMKKLIDESKNVVICGASNDNTSISSLLYELGPESVIFKNALLEECVYDG